MTATISIMELNNYQPLDSLKPENQKELVSKLEVFEVKAGEVIFKCGDKDNAHIYLYAGDIDLVKNGKTLKTISAGTADAKQAIAHVFPRKIDAIASTDVTLFKIDADLLDLMLTWNQTGSFTVEELEEDDDWMSRLLQTEVFRRIPPANIQAIFTSLEDIKVKRGDVVIKQGDPGDYFYIIKSGRCRVFRRMPGQDKDIRLADLSMGDSFGEEALISDTTRNASIVALGDGVITRLSKEHFLELLNEPMLDKIDYPAACKKIADGEAQWLDVRLPTEHAAAYIRGSANMPLIFLRMKAGSLDKNTHYILYCDTERRSSAASYLLNERGFHTSVLTNGLKDVPTADMEGSGTEP